MSNEFGILINSFLICIKMKSIFGEIVLEVERRKNFESQDTLKILFCQFKEDGILFDKK